MFLQVFFPSFQIDMKKIQLEILKPYITSKLNAIIPIEDDVIIEYVFSQLEQSKVIKITNSHPLIWS